MINREQQQFLALLRAGLWDTPAEATLFSGSVNWEAIFTCSVQQTVLGLVAEGINSLPSVYQPPAAIQNKMRSRLTSGIRSHAHFNRVLAELVTMLRQKGICPVLLKGQGVAMDYADPTRRQCGDIDLYIGQEDYERACSLARQQYGTDRHATESEKHYHFSHDGVIIELHRIAERLPAPWHNHRFQHWTQHHLQSNHLRRVEIGGTEIALPPIHFDALYIFNHAWHHFSAGGGIGLRQLCDWVRYLHTFHQEINREELKRNLKAFGIWRAWRIFGCIAVDTLGLPEDEFPFYTSRYVRYGEKMLAMIQQEGNFGFFDASRTRRPDGYIAGKLHSLKRMHLRMGRLFPVYSLSISMTWGRYIYNGIRQVLTDQLPKEKQL